MRSWLDVVLAGGLVAGVLATGTLVAWRRASESPGRNPITLPGGGPARVRAVTYGTNHVYGPVWARALARIPGTAGHLVRSWTGAQGALSTRITLQPAVVAWLVADTPAGPLIGPGQPMAYALLANEQGFFSGPSADVAAAGPVPLVFETFPRRAARLEMRFCVQDSQGKFSEAGTVRFPNPARGQFGQWTPEALPAVKAAGDVRVTLESFKTGHNGNRVYRTLPDGKSVDEDVPKEAGERNVSSVRVRFDLPEGSTQKWTVSNVAISDATGNRVRQTTFSVDHDKGRFQFSPSLWPDEAAWKMEVEVKKRAGFAPEELFTVKGVRIEEGERKIGFSTNVGGVTITLDRWVRRAPPKPGTWSSESAARLSGTVGVAPDNVHVDLVSAVTDTGEPLESGGSSMGGLTREWWYRTAPAKAQAADFTFAVHRSRWVEYLVKPELAAPAGTNTLKSQR